LGSLPQHVEGRFLVHSVEQDEHPFGLLDHGPVLGEFGDRSG
jgi:hypothetical protein